MDSLYKDNIKFVSSIAKKYYFPGYGLDYEDLLQAGLYGLCEAKIKWDINKGTFLTFARHYIHKYIYIEFNRFKNKVYYPRWACLKNHQIDKYISDYQFSHNGDTPSVENIAEYLGVKSNLVIDLLKYKSNEILSLDSKVNQSSKNTTVFDEYCETEDTNNNIDNINQKEIINNVRVIMNNHLTHSEKTIMDEYYFNNKTQNEIGKKYSVPPNKIKQIIMKSQKKLKKAMINNGEIYEYASND